MSGTPDIDDELIAEREAQEELVRQQRETQQLEATASPEQPQTEEQKPQVETPKQEVTAEPKKEKEEDEEEQSAIEFAGELAAAPVVGVTDFAVDLINIVPGVEIPKVPEFESDLITAINGESYRQKTITIEFQ